MKPALTVFTYPGIGDFSWCYSKLVSLGRPLNIIYQGHPKRPAGAVDRRVEQLLKLLPAVQSYSVARIDVKRFARPAPSIEALRTGTQVDFAINAHLEAGHRIETYAPDLETEFHYAIQIPDENRRGAQARLDGRTDYLLFYCSSFQTSRAWNGWQPEDWADLARRYRVKFGDRPVVLTGAKWDAKMAAEVTKLIPDCLNLVGQTQLGASLELINRSHYFVAFPSGMPVMATVLRKPVFMLYPKCLQQMLWTWASPEMIKNRDYMASLFKAPAAVMGDIEQRSNTKV